MNQKAPHPTNQEKSERTTKSWRRERKNDHTKRKESTTQGVVFSSPASTGGMEGTRSKNTWERFPSSISRFPPCLSPSLSPSLLLFFFVVLLVTCFSSISLFPPCLSPSPSLSLSVMHKYNLYRYKFIIYTYI